MRNDDVLQKLAACVENGVKGVSRGEGLIIIHLTETGLCMEVFNCESEELYEALATAQDLAESDDSEETLQ